MGRRKDYDKILVIWFHTNAIWSIYSVWKLVYIQIMITTIPTKKLKNGFEIPVFGLGTWQMGGRMERDINNDDNIGDDSDSSRVLTTGARGTLDRENSSSLLPMGSDSSKKPASSDINDTCVICTHSSVQNMRHTAKLKCCCIKHRFGLPRMLCNWF